jgi:transcriptional regulator with XRE-family HTH domain
MSIPPEIASLVGANARRLRTDRGWSLDALAARSGVSKGMLVQIEQARTNPSLGTLCRLAEALSVSVAALIETTEAPTVWVVEPGEGTALWTSDAGGAGKLLAGSDEREHVEFWHWELRPGDEHRAEHGHVAGTLELLYVLAGELVLTVDSDDHHLVAGSAVSFRADRRHGYRNDADRPCEFAMVVLQPDADLTADLHAWGMRQRQPAG